MNHRIYYKKTNMPMSSKTNWLKYVGLLEDRQYELDNREYIEANEEMKYRLLTNIIKKLALEASRKDYRIEDGIIIKQIGNHRKMI